MVKGILITNGYAIADGIKHQICRLKEEFFKLGVEVDVKKNNELLTYIDKGNISCSLKGYDFAMYLDKDRYVADMLERSGLRLFNKMSSIVKCDDKMLTHICLSNAGIKMPTSISSTLCYHDDGDRDYLNDVEKKLGYPLIVKENYGSLGKQVYLISNRKELEDIENKLIHVPHIFQEFISSSKGIDYRIIVIGNKPVAFMRRENKHSYLSNLATGGKAYKVDLPKEYLDVAIKASKILNLDYCGVDILVGPNGEPILSEVNSNAFFEGIEKTTRINVAGSYAKYVLEQISK